MTIHGIMAGGQEIPETIFADLRALVSRDGAADQLNIPFIVNYPSETPLPRYDYGGWHDPAANTSRLTVPAGLGITYARLNAGLYPDVFPARAGQVMKKGGANFLGQGADWQSQSGHSEILCSNSAIVQVAAGNYFQNNYENGLTGNDLSDAGRQQENWFAAEAIDPDLVGALTGRTGLAGQALATGTWAAIVWADPLTIGGGAYDLGGYWAAGQPTRFTIPAGGAGFYRISGGMFNGTNDMNIRMYKNGGGTDPSVGVGWDPITNGYGTFASFAISCNAGDYFEMFAEVASASTIGSDTRNWFCIEKINPLVKRALIGTSGAKTLGTTAGPVTCATEYYDTAAMANLGTNASRVFFPSGSTKARAIIGAGVVTGSGKVDLVARCFNASAVQIGRTGVPRQVMGNVTLWESMNAMGAWRDVEPGGFFELYTDYNENSRNFTATTPPWLYVECL